ncbi:MAG: type II secretion system F family protein [Mycobacteriales bacterium]|nr:type II secretion system F family protein [Mycobacteriales bacterium]
MSDPNVLLAWLLGAGAGLGLLMLTIGLRGTDPAAPAATRRFRVTRTQLRRLATAAGTAVLVLLVTRWIAAAAGTAVLVLYWDTVFGGTRRARLATARLEALATWTESLRDLVATGIALPEALPASVSSSSPLLRPQLLRLQERINAREPLEGALRALGDDLADGGADLVVAALLLNTRAQGRALEAVLSALASSLREELRVRRTIEAERRSTRRAVQIVVAVTLLTALGLCLGNPVYVEPYRTAAGQLMLALVTAVFGVGFAWLARLSALPATPRLLPAGSDRAGVRR